jgi:hypothetical protein
MEDFEQIKQALRIIEGDDGTPYVQLPLVVWLDLISSNMPIPQHERLKALMQKWELEPDDTPPEWWDEFEQQMLYNKEKA